MKCSLGISNFLEEIAAAAVSPQSCPTPCDPIDGSPPGSSVPGILQARTLEWVAVSFSNAWKWKVKVKSLSLVGLLATPWTAAHQAPPSMGFSRQEYWSGAPLPSPIYSLTNSQSIWYSQWSLQSTFWPIPLCFYNSVHMPADLVIHIFPRTWLNNWTTLNLFTLSGPWSRKCQ